MTSEIFPGSTYPTCIRFWYYMKAQLNIDFGTLSVIKFNYENQTNTTLWSLNKGQGAVWLEATVSYFDLGSYSIIFEATKGTIYQADIAIDDISFFASSYCNTTVVTSPATLTSPKTVSKLSTTTPYAWISQSDFDCNFENGSGLWTNDKTSDFFWKIGKSSSTIYNSGIVKYNLNTK
jgi:hypothetical protein